MYAYDSVESGPRAERPPHRGLPSTSLTVVFALDSPLLVSETPGEWASERGAHHDVCVSGFHTAPAYLQRPDRQVGVQLEVHPLACRRLLGLPAAELTALTQEGEDVVGAAARRLQPRLCGAGDDERPALVGQELAALAGTHERVAPPRPEVVHAWRLVERSRGRISVDELARAVALSPRHLSSLVRAELGLSTKRLTSLFRFDAAHRALVDALRQGTRPPLADLAHAHGFADHSHLDREY